MSSGAWIMLFLGLAVLLGGLVGCIAIALKADKAGSPASGEGDA
jgi:hypothetical protein